MKVLAIVLVALVLTSTLAIQARSPSLAAKKKIDNLMNNKQSWSSIILKLAQLQSKAGNPIAELLAAIEKIIADLATKSDKATQDFDQRTGQHQNEIKRLQLEIDNANADVANNDAFVKEVLRPMKASLEDDIARLQAEIAKDRIFLEEAATQREKDHIDFTQKITDIDGGLEAIKECLAIVDQFESGASFAQIQRAKNHLNKLQSVLSKNPNTQLVKALVQIAASSQLDGKTVQQLRDQLHKVAEAFREAQAKLTADENKAQEDYAKQVDEKENEIKSFEAETIDKRTQLENTEKKIESTLQLIAQRQNDAVEFKKEFDSENADYENYTNNYNDLMAQFAKEDAACHEALDILSGQEFTGYIADRMSQTSDHVIGTNTGSGVEVN